MENVTMLLGMFVVGFAWDAVITFDTLATIGGRRKVVFVSTFLITVISSTAYIEVLSSEGAFRWQRIIALALGSAVGAVVTIGFYGRKNKVRP